MANTNAYAKHTLIAIIILLCIFIPGAVIGTVRHINNNKGGASVGEENINKSFYFNGSLYFYLNDELLGTYPCDTCNIVTPTIDDSSYHTKYYKDGSDILQPVLSNLLAIFTEGDKIALYSIPIGKINNYYEAVKTYSLGEKNGLILYKENGLWGVLNPNDVTAGIKANYEYLACPTDLVDGKLDMSKLIAKFGDTWKIIDINDETIIESKNEIVDFNDNYYVIYKNNQYFIFDYNNNQYLEEEIIKDINILDKYVFVYTDGKISVYKSLTDDAVKNIEINTSSSNIDYKLNENKYDVIVDGNVIQSIELGSNI